MALSLLVVAFLALVPLQDVPKPTIYVATTNRDAAIGRLIWVAKDRGGKVVSRGDRKLTLKDVKIEVSKSVMGTIISKVITLGEHFNLEYASFPESSPKDLSGFGLTGARDDADTFCWEWFEVVSPTRATKLQETGELGIAIGKVEGGYDVLRTNFLTDVSIRVYNAGKASEEPPRWRISILKGSHIDWPKLEKGKVQKL